MLSRPEHIESKSITTIQAQRGLAAIYVAFYHVYIIFMEPQYGERVINQDFARHGFLGVAYFFVLSGFIISLAHVKDFGLASNVPLYLRKRFERVYPAYWVYLTGFLVAAGLGLGYPDFSWSPVNIVVSYVLLPLGYEVTLPLKVAWTLVHEVMFYLMFSVFLLHARTGYAVFSLWFVLILCNFVFNFSPGSIFLSHWNLYFFGGIASFFIYKSLPPRLGVFVFFGGICCLWGYVMLSGGVNRIGDLRTPGNEYLHILLIPAFLLIVSGTALFERHTRTAVPLVLRFLGDASYSIYLVHSAIISVIAILGKKFGLFEAVGYDLFFMVCFVGSVVGGCMAYVVIERPITSSLARRRVRS